MRRQEEGEGDGRADGSQEAPLSPGGEVLVRVWQLTLSVTIGLLPSYQNTVKWSGASYNWLTFNICGNLEFIRPDICLCQPFTVKREVKSCYNPGVALHFWWPLKQTSASSTSRNINSKERESSRLQKRVFLRLRVKCSQLRWNITDDTTFHSK